MHAGRGSADNRSMTPFETSRLDHDSMLAARLEDRRRSPSRDYDDAVWAGRIRRALDEQRFELSSEPMQPLTGGSARQELTLRMITEDGQHVTAAAFAPAAERCGLAAGLDRLVIAKAVRFAALGRIVHVTLSASAVADAFVTDVIGAELRAVGAPAASICFEVLADACMRAEDGGAAFAAGLHGLGCGLALRGVPPVPGFLARLGQLPFQALRIERGLVEDLTRDPAERRRVRTLVSIARALDLTTLADGVDCTERLALVRRYGVDYAQGTRAGSPVWPA
jgi:EAL domain-containing protein (putative c-di-GMP-specific phosphodiesterase class I)